MLSLAYSNISMSSAPNSAPKILIVDDQLPVLLTLKRAMRRQFNIEVAMGAEQALERLTSQSNFAVILSDMHMPGMNGLEFLKEARRISPNTARIMLTGSIDLNVTLKALNDCQVFKFLQKPCSQDDIVLAIHEGAQEFRRRETPDHGVTTVVLSKFQEQLRAPLSQIVTFAKLIKNDQSTKGLLKEYAEQIIENGQSVLDASETILDIVAIQAKQYVPVLSEFNIQTMLRNAALPDKKLAMAKGLSINLEAPASLTNMVSDERLLKRALTELISNSVKFSTANSDINIRIRRQDEDSLHILFEIEDQGCGMEDTTKFTNLSELDTEDCKNLGDGLGLPLVYSTAETLGGYLEIASTPTKGTIVRLFIPINLDKTS